jgi:hypothetical protein
VTVEELLDAGALPTPTVAALSDRYIRGWSDYGGV